jgi:hypothetical protein
MGAASGSHAARAFDCFESRQSFMQSAATASNCHRLSDQELQAASARRFRRRSRHLVPANVRARMRIDARYEVGRPGSPILRRVRFPGRVPQIARDARPPRGPTIFGGFALGTGCQEILHIHKMGKHRNQPHVEQEVLICRSLGVNF